MPQTQYSSALNKAMSLLRRKFYSQWEMRSKLKKNDFDDETISDVINYLENSGYINDHKLCQALFDKYSRDEKCGSALTVSKLMARGLPKTMIYEIMKEYDFDNETEQALNLAKKRYKCEGKPSSSELGKIARYLTSRGFSASTVNKTIQSLKNAKCFADSLNR